MNLRDKEGRTGEDTTLLAGAATIFTCSLAHSPSLTLTHSHTHTLTHTALHLAVAAGNVPVMEALVSLCSVT